MTSKDDRRQRLRPADASDLPSVRALLAASSLTLAGLEEFFPTGFAVAIAPDGTLAGVAGIETRGDVALLRSVAVAPAVRRSGLGEALVEDRLEAARSAGLDEAYLLTTTAAAWFARLGFRKLAREAAPESLSRSAELRGACPESAVLMSRPLGGAALRAMVRDRYGAAARRAGAPGASCCAPSDGASACGCDDSENAVSAGLYDATEAAAVPETALRASLGCGNPSALARLAPGEIVLDLGSGGGIDVLLSARRVGPTGRAYGLDMTDEMLALARENLRLSGLANAEFLKGEIEAIPLPDASVDVVLSNCVINLTADKSRALAEAFRVLKPGGRLAISDVVARGEMPLRVRRDLEAWAGCVAGALEENEYSEILRDVGFEDVTIETIRELDGRDARGSGSPSHEGRIASAFVRAVKPERKNSAATAAVAGREIPS